MKNRLTLLSALLLMGIFVLSTNCGDTNTSDADNTDSEEVEGEEVATDCDHRYPNHAGPSPPGVPAEDLYYLNQDWPEEPVSLSPAVTERLHSYLPITPDNVADLMFYMRAMIFEDLVPSDFSQRNTDWFAVPNLGTREAMHGMYDGNNINAGVWDPAQTEEAINFTTDLYNNVSAYTIGQVWGDCSRSPNDPNISLETNQFPEGSIIIKLAMSAIPLNQAPFLEGAFSWDVYADVRGDTTGHTTGSGPNFQPTMVRTHLIQMDMIIKDKELAPETGWFFSTFVYDKNAAPVDMPAGTPAEKTGLYKMIPLGAMWGNDPGIVDRAELKETVLNPHWTTNTPQFIANTLGLNGRLSGPIDDVGNRGSCMQCHLSAEWNTQGVDDNFATIFGTLAYPRVEWTEAQKIPWLWNYNGTQSYGNTEISPEVTQYITDSLGIQIGPEWIGMDYDFVMTAAAINAAINEKKISGGNPLIGKFH